MNQFATVTSLRAPALIAAAVDQASTTSLNSSRRRSGPELGPRLPKPPYLTNGHHLSLGLYLVR